MDPTEPTTFEHYAAFISYRRQDSAGLARWIRDRLQRYKLPPEVLKELPPEKKALHEQRPKVWLDKAFEKPSDDFLTKKIFPALDQSDRLIVISTPSVFDTVPGKDGTEEPNWLVREIDRYLDGAGADASPRPVDLVLGPGGSENRFPGRLAEKERWDWIDFRHYNWWRSWGLSEELDVGLTKLVAGLYDIPEAQLPVLRQEERRRRNRLLIGLLSFIITVALLISGLAAYAWIQRNVAKQEARNALARQLAAQAELLHIQNPQFLERSTLLAIQAIRLLQSIETNGALRSNLEILPRRLVLLKHTHPVTLLALSHDRKYLAASSMDKVVRVWEFPLGRQVASLSHLAQVTKIAFSPVGHQIVTGTENGKLVAWELPSGKLWRSLDLKSRIDALEFSPDGRNVLVAGPDIGVRLWSPGSDASERVLAADKVIAATFRSDSRFVATAGLEDDRVRIWDTKEMNIALELQQTDAPHELAFSPDGRYLAVASGLANQKKGNTIWLWDVQDVRRVARLQQEGYIRAIHFSPDGSMVAATVEDGFARVWRTASGEAVAAFTHGAPYAIRSVAWSADGQLLATSSTDRTARVWNLRSGREIARMTHGDTVNALLFSPDPPYLVTASGGPLPYWHDRSVCIWELPPGTEHVRLVHPAGANSIIFSPDGRMVATSSSDGIVRLFKVPSGEILTTFNHGHTVSAVAFGPRGEWLAAASDRRSFPEPQDDLVWVWDVSRQKESLRIPQADLVRSIAVSPDGHYLATGGGGGILPKTQDRSVHVWEMPGGRPVATIPAASDVLEVGFSHDGKLGASIERTGILTLWRPESGAEVARLDLGVQAQGFAFDYSGHRLAVATLDSARIYDLRNLRELKRIPHESFVNAVAFSPDDRYLASGDSGKSAHVWELNENREIARFYHDESVSSVAFSPDGRLLATTVFGKTPAHLWKWRREDLVAEACARLTRDLTKQEWRQYLGGELQHPTCNHTP